MNTCNVLDVNYSIKYDSIFSRPNRYLTSNIIFFLIRLATDGYELQGVGVLLPRKTTPALRIGASRTYFRTRESSNTHITYNGRYSIRKSHLTGANHTRSFVKSTFRTWFAVLLRTVCSRKHDRLEAVLDLQRVVNNLEDVSNNLFGLSSPSQL